MTKIIKAILISAFFILIASGCSKEKETTLKIGSILPLSGAAAQMGQEMQKGQMLAVDYWNSHTENEIQKITIDFQDSKSNPKDAISTFQLLRASKINIFTVSLSTVAVALKPLAEREKVLLFADVSHPAVTSPTNPLIFRHSQTAEIEAQGIVDDIIKRTSSNRLVVFYNVDEYGSAFIKSVEMIIKKHSISVTYIPFTKDTADYRTLALKEPLNEKDVLLVIGVGQPMGLLIRSLREIGFKGLIYANIGYAVTGGREIAGNAGKGVRYTNIAIPPSEYGQWVSEEYKKRYNKKISNEALLEFDTISLIVLAAKEAKSAEPLAIANKMGDAVKKYYGSDLMNKNNDIHLNILIEEDHGIIK